MLLGVALQAWHVPDVPNAAGVVGSSGAVAEGAPGGIALAEQVLKNVGRE